MTDKDYNARRYERWYLEDHLEQLKSIINTYNRTHCTLFREVKEGKPLPPCTPEFLANRELCMEVGQCIRCGSKRNLHCHHVIPRVEDMAIDSLENLVCICCRCHAEIHSRIKNIHDSSLVDVTFDFLNELDEDQ